MFVSINPMRIFKKRNKEGILILKPRGLGYKYSHEDELSYALEDLFQDQERKSIFVKTWLKAYVNPSMKGLKRV